MVMSYGADAMAAIGTYLTASMDVYEPNQTTGQFDTRVASSIPCSLALMGADAAPSVELRAGMLSHRVLAYDPSVQLTRGQQVEINAQRWNPVAGTFVDATTPDGVLLYRRVDVRLER
jgi:hypothetical protein